jgi:hypothetical protein
MFSVHGSLDLIQEIQIQIQVHYKRNLLTHLPPFFTQQSHEKSTLLRVAAD